MAIKTIFTGVNLLLPGIRGTKPESATTPDRAIMDALLRDFKYPKSGPIKTAPVNGSTLLCGCNCGTEFFASAKTKENMIYDSKTGYLIPQCPSCGAWLKL